MNIYRVGRATGDGETKHFLFFEVWAHPNFVLASAPSLRSALRSFALNEFVVEGKDGFLRPYDSPDGDIIYSHELEAIECTTKMLAPEWNVKLLNDNDWDKPIVPVCDDPGRSANARYIKLCRQELGDKHKLPRHAFVWHLHSGHLVTFYRRLRGRNMHSPAALSQRFIIPTERPDQVFEWAGDYDDILSDLIL